MITISVETDEEAGALARLLTTGQLGELGMPVTLVRVIPGWGTSAGGGGGGGGGSSPAGWISGAGGTGGYSDAGPGGRSSGTGGGGAMRLPPCRPLRRCCGTEPGSGHRKGCGQTGS